MTVEWIRHDDSTHYVNLGKALLVTVVQERIGAPGWKVHVGKRSLKDKIPDLDAAKRVALAFAHRVLKEVVADLEVIAPSAPQPPKESA